MSASDLRGSARVFAASALAAFPSLINRLRPLAIAALFAGVASACDEPPTAVDGGPAGPAFASAPISSVELSLDKLDVGVGGSATVTCQPRDAQGVALLRNCNFRSRDLAVATVTGSGTRTGTVTGKSTGATWVVANAEQSKDSVRVQVGTQPPTEPPPAGGDTTLVLTPATASLLTGATQQFAAQGQTSWGTTVPLTLSWTATGGTIDGSGKYTAGSTAGSFRVVARAGTRADTSAVTIGANIPPNPPPPPPVAGSCLQGSSTVRLAGDRGTSSYVELDLPSGTRIDASGAVWSSTKSSGATIRLGGSSGICWRGGEVRGLYNQNSTSWDLYHNISNFSIRGPNMVVEDFKATNMGDCIATNEDGDNWTARRIHCVDMHDDCFESDWGKSGRLSDALLEGCYVGIATRPRSSSPVNASRNTIVLENVILWMKAIPNGYGGGTNSHGPLFKFDRSSPSTSPRVIVKNSIFRVDRNAAFQGVCLNEQGLVTAENSIIVWLGQGDYPCGPIPPGWTLTRDKGVYDRAVADWKARHPGL